ncbi:hypothetical protein NM82_1140 [Neisseria meningitidis NM82]|nr:hypothetical protein NM82_1141 [Neisseria meningitidis NM82]EOB99868.1 hypothetical protein NM82_1140 [Neisseria meningitidis NM82]
MKAVRDIALWLAVTFGSTFSPTITAMIPFHRDGTDTGMQTIRGIPMCAFCCLYF